MRRGTCALTLVLLGACSGSGQTSARGASIAAAGVPRAEPRAPAIAAPERHRSPLTLDDVLVVPASDPLASWTSAALRDALARFPASLGSVSIGAPNRGALLNGVRMLPGADWDVLNPDRSWATADTAEAIARAARTLRRQFPDARLVVGDISQKSGGFFSPHSSHQSGRDADLGYFYRVGARWYTPARASNLDVARTWALVRALFGEGDVQYVFMDRSIQALLAEHALEDGADPRWLDALFECRGNRQAPIRHRWGHTTHLHVRFFDESATRIGARIARL